MILELIPVHYEAELYTGTNLEVIDKFCKRHGTAIDFQTGKDGITRGYLQTLSGTVEIVPGVTLACGMDDQLFKLNPREVGEEFPAKYRKVSEDGRLGVWTPPSASEPVPISLIQSDDEEPQPVEIRLQELIDKDPQSIVVDDYNPTPQVVELSMDERMKRIESILLNLTGGQ